MIKVIETVAAKKGLLIIYETVKELRNIRNAKDIPFIYK